MSAINEMGERRGSARVEESRNVCGRKHEVIMGIALEGASGVIQQPHGVDSTNEKINRDARKEVSVQLRIEEDNKVWDPESTCPLSLFDTLNI